MDNKTLKELLAPNVTYQALCIQYPLLDVDFELKFALIHLLPKFHGLAGEDPYKHLKEFHVVCNSMKPHRTDEDHIKLIAFPTLWMAERSTCCIIYNQHQFKTGMT